MSVIDNKLATYRIVRGSTDTILIGDSNSANIRATGGIGKSNSTGTGNIYEMNRSFLDTGISTTSATTYKVTVYGDGVDVFVNRHQDSNTGPDYGRFASTIIAMEVGA